MATADIEQAELAADADVPVGVVLGQALLEAAAADIGVQREVLRQAPLAADAVVPAVGTAVPLVIGVGHDQLVGLVQRGGGDQLVVVLAAGTESISVFGSPGPKSTPEPQTPAYRPTGEV
ncbi:hypothetical protein G6F22_019641 [Rhizopus arrhizus]|nr:hypothetical protein G6F22_019641 [Rhizopus arrhizus]KAG1179273.1 hypothetical protein G6F35_016244 [Rhizopus arrhizus]